MLGLVAVVGGIVGLVSLAWHEKEDPTIGPVIARARLSHLTKIAPGRLTLAQASDGVVLSRRLGIRELETRFSLDEARLRRLMMIAETKRKYRETLSGDPLATIQVKTSSSCRKRR